MPEKIRLEQHIQAEPERVFQAFLDPDDLMGFYHASPGWTTPYAKIDAVPGGRLSIGFMDPAEKNSFDYAGKFDEIKKPELIRYTLDDGRQVEIRIQPTTEGVLVHQMFEADDEMSHDAQKQGWMAILSNLKNYLENSTKGNHLQD